MSTYIERSMTVESNYAIAEKSHTSFSISLFSNVGSIDQFFSFAIREINIQKSRLRIYRYPHAKSVFHWFSKVITWLPIATPGDFLKIAPQFFDQWEAKPRPITSSTRHFPHALSKFRIIAGNCDWFITRLASCWVWVSTLTDSLINNFYLSPLSG